MRKQTEEKYGLVLEGTKNDVWINRYGDFSNGMDKVFKWIRPSDAKLSKRWQSAKNKWDMLTDEIDDILSELDAMVTMENSD